MTRVKVNLGLTGRQRAQVGFENPGRNQTVRTYSPFSRQATEVSLEVGARAALVVGTVIDFDALERVVTQTEVGGGASRSRVIVRDALGFVAQVTEADGAVVKHVPNLLGWDDEVHQQRDVGGSPFDVSTYLFNRRGQVTSVTDAALQTTTQLYNGFGEVRARTVPGTPGVQATFEYDTLGRVTRRTHGATTLGYSYNAIGKLSVIRNAAAEPLIVRSYDALGRLQVAVNLNEGARSLPANFTGRGGTATFLYDSLGRVRQDSVLVDAQPARAVTSAWSISPTTQTWQRHVTYPSGTAWDEHYDGDGRLVSKTGGALARTTTYDYVGNRYAGRSVGRLSSSPLRQQVDFDAFGQPQAWRVTAVDSSGTGLPINASEGATYCNGSWTAACARPLLSISVLRDVRGRIGSLNQAWASPTLAAPDETWRGYLFDGMGRMKSTFERPVAVSTAGFVTHALTPAQVRQLGVASTEWGYTRASAVGDLLSISQVAAPSVKRFEAGARGPGHQLTSVTPPAAAPQTIAHDASGRIVDDGVHRYEWDDLHQLAVVSSQTGAVQEGMLYDGIGRLVATVRPDDIFLPAPLPPSINLIRNVFAYDGLQMVASYAASATPSAQVLEWEASWGPGIDNLESVQHTASRNCGIQNVPQACVGAGDEVLAILDNRNSVVGSWSLRSQQLLATAEYSPEGHFALKRADGAAVCDTRIDASCTGPAAVPFTFNAGYTSATELVYMRNRWYSPALAQFVSHDPLGFVDSFSAYAFAGMDPINGWDPFGLNSRSLAKSVNSLVLTAGGGNTARPPPRRGPLTGRPIGEDPGLSENGRRLAEDEMFFPPVNRRETRDVPAQIGRRRTNETVEEALARARAAAGIGTGGRGPARPMPAPPPPRPYPNQLPATLAGEREAAAEVGVVPAAPGTRRFKDVLQRQSDTAEPINWVVTQSGQFRIGPAEQGGERITHAVLASGEPVIAAGTARVTIGAGQAIGTEITAQSGHYFYNQPASATTQSLNIGRAAFEISGITFPK